MIRAVRVIGVTVLLAGLILLGASGARAAGPLTWSAPTDIEFASSGTPTAVACATADLCVAGDDTGALLSTTDPSGGAKAWTGGAVDVSGGTAHAITGLACPSTTLCVAVDDAGGVLTTTDPTGPASGWARVAVDTTSTFTGVSCGSVTWCVAVDKAGNAWSTQTPTAGAAAWMSTATGADGALTAIACPTDALCVATDHGGDVLTETAQSPSWAVTNLSPHALTTVACASVTLCLAGGIRTGALSSSAPTGGAAAWQAQRITHERGGPETVTAVACSQDATCVAGVQYGGLYATEDPIAGTWKTADGQFGNDFNPVALSCAPTGGCTGVDNEGNAGGLASGQFFDTQIEGDAPDLSGVACPQADRCFADDANGQILTSHDPAGGAASWTASILLPNAEEQESAVPYQLACPSVSLCLTGIGYDQRGDAGDTPAQTAAVSTHPAGTTPWTLFHPFRRRGFIGVTCTSASQCVAADDKGQLYLSHHPSRVHSWAAVGATRSASGVYCPQQGRCLGVNTTCPSRGFCARLLEKQGAIATSTTPERRDRRWTTLTVDPGEGLTGLTCPSARLCYAVDQVGTVLVSTHPTTASSWSVADKAGVALNAIACPTSRSCIAVGANGTAVTASTPSG
jgi:hypothetical protein